MNQNMNGLKMLEVHVPTNGKAIHPILVLDKDGVSLIDTGWPMHAAELIQQMSEAGVAMDMLKRIIITHQDGDHTGSIPELLRRSGYEAKLVASKEEEPYLNGSLPILAKKREMIENGMRMAPENIRNLALPVLLSPATAQVDETVKDGDEIGSLTVVHTPGHTPGHISLYHRESKTLITGDAMVVENGELHGPNPAATPDMDTAVESLKKFRDYEINTVLCYHGGVYQGDFASRLEELIANGK